AASKVRESAAGTRHFDGAERWSDRLGGKAGVRYLNLLEGRQPIGSTGQQYSSSWIGKIGAPPKRVNAVEGVIGPAIPELAIIEGRIDIARRIAPGDPPIQQHAVIEGIGRINRVGALVRGDGRGCPAHDLGRGRGCGRQDCDRGGVWNESAFKRALRSGTVVGIGQDCRISIRDVRKEMERVVPRSQLGVWSRYRAELWTLAGVDLVRHPDIRTGVVMAARTGLSSAAGLGIPEKRLAELLCGKFVDDDAARVRDRRPFAQRRD